ncbi:hypothetical protein [Stenotrophomonas maltophilia group sp. LNF259]
MDFVAALSECWWLGHECTPNWDAWGATFALTGVGATIALGIFTYRLGVAARNASMAALEISQESHRTQELDRKREAAFVMHFLHGEFVWTAARIRRFYECLGSEVEVTGDLDKSQREKFTEMVRMLEMRQTQSLMSRLHVLDDPHGAMLARVLGQARLFHKAFEKFADPAYEPDIQFNLDGFRAKGPRLEDDLKTLAKASKVHTPEDQDAN